MKNTQPTNAIIAVTLGCNAKCKMCDIWRAKVDGEVSMRPHDGGSVVDMDFRVRSGIPLLGKKLAEFVAGITAELLAKEADFLRERD